MQQKIQLFILLLISTQLYFIQTHPLQAKKVKYAINCGSEIDKRGLNGIIFDVDNYYDPNDGSKTIDYGQKEEYKEELLYYSFARQMHLTQRYSENSFSYKIPFKGLKEQKYVIIMSFMEMEYARHGKRVFNVKLGDQVVIPDLDVASRNRIAKFHAHNEYIEVELKNNQLKWNKPKSREHYIIDLNPDQTLTIEFEKNKEYPFVNSILLYDGSIFDTDFYEQGVVKDKWERENRDKLRQEYKKMKAKEEEEQIERRKKLEIKRRQREIKDQEAKRGEREIPPFTELLMTPFGILCMISFFIVTFVLIYFTFFDPYGIEKEERERERMRKIRAKQVQDQQQYQQRNDYYEDDALTQRKTD